MGLPEPQEQGGDARPFTYADYVKWPDDERWELIEGQAYAMTPAPTVKHQQVLASLFFALMQYFQKKNTCRVLPAPLDVRFAQTNEPDEAVETVVQPDLLVVCDPAKVDEKGVRGAPDLVVEILSETSVARDLGNKLRLYEKHGVRCYIIADPWGQTLMVRYRDEGGLYGHPELFADKDRVPIRIFEGLTIDLPTLFGD